MSKQEILTMEAGGKLDELIAEEIFHRVYKARVMPCSTDISAAWQVVGRLVKRYVFDLYFDDVGDCWVCKLFDGQQEYKGYGQAAPEAICKAALIAKRRLR